MIQISSGLIRGLTLKSPRGSGTRPTSERTRQAIFNVLRNFNFQGNPILEGALVADVFAGTGAWGIEAASNGATAVYFVESAGSALQVLKANLATASKSMANQDLHPEFHVIGKELSPGWARLPKVRVLFCDPPYKLGYFEKAVALEAHESRIEPGGLFLFESDAKEALDESGLSAAGLRRFDTKTYGDSAIHFFVKG